MKTLNYRRNKKTQKFEVYRNITDYMIQIITSFDGIEDAKEFIKNNN